jgi:hypothetical protein
MLAPPPAETTISSPPVKTVETVTSEELSLLMVRSPTLLHAVKAAVTATINSPVLTNLFQYLIAG